MAKITLEFDTEKDVDIIDDIINLYNKRQNYPKWRLTDAEISRRMKQFGEERKRRLDLVQELQSKFSQ